MTLPSQCRFDMADVSTLSLPSLPATQIAGDRTGSRARAGTVAVFVDVRCLDMAVAACLFHSRARNNRSIVSHRAASSIVSSTAIEDDSGVSRRRCSIPYQPGLVETICLSGDRCPSAEGRAASELLTVACWPMLVIPVADQGKGQWVGLVMGSGDALVVTGEAYL